MLEKDGEIKRWMSQHREEGLNQGLQCLGGKVFRNGALVWKHDCLGVSLPSRIFVLGKEICERGT